MRTENLAIMFTDMSGFTERTSSQTREENALMLELHEALLLPVLRAFRGKRVKSIGDAFLVTFRSPTDAVLCGMAIQDRLHEYNRDVPKTLRIEVRVAVNLGEVRMVRGDVFGEPVNIASRVEGITPPGEIYLTESVYLAMNKREVPSASVGDKTLKGIPEKVGVYKVPRGGSEAAGDYPFGGRELAQVKDSGAKLHLARELALSIGNSVGSSIDKTGESLTLASSSMRGFLWSIRYRLKRRAGKIGVGVRNLPRRYRKWENRVGRWRVRGAALALLVASAAAGIGAYEALHFDPYSETRALIRQGAYPTALARLDVLGRNKEYLTQGEYWFLRGRANLGRGLNDNALDAYKEAIAHDARWRTSSQLIADVVQILARKHSVRAQKLVLTELGPNAEAALLEEMVTPQATARWLAVETAEQLGGKDRIPYGSVAMVDFENETSCAKRKISVQKLGEYGEREALPALQGLKDQPDYKCLQGVLTVALQKLQALPR